MHQRIDQQLLQNNLWNLQHPGRIEALVALDTVQVALHEGKSFGVLRDERAADVLAVQIAGICNAGAWEGHGLDGKRRPPARDIAPEKQQPHQLQLQAVAQPQIVQYGIQRQVGIGAIGAIVLLQILPKDRFIDVGTGRICHRHQVGIHQAHTLEHALQFFTCSHLALVRPLLDPDAPLMVEVRLG